jgi:hypothetical protein
MTNDCAFSEHTGRRPRPWSMRTRAALIGATALISAGMAVPTFAQAPQQKPNIVLIVSDDTGFGDLGPYGGGIGRGMPTPSLDRLSSEGMTFFSFYAQPSCTPGRAARCDGRFPRSAVRP